jgi:ATP-dependent DNA helicase RecG
MVDLAAELGHVERDNVEWKRDASDRDVLRKAVCALANDLPERGIGHLLIGVRDDGTPTGLLVDDKLILQITNIRDEAQVLPRPVMAVEKATFAGGDCVHVTVQPSRVRPVRFDGVVWVRVGTSTRRASREEELLLAERTRAADLPFDQRPIDGSSVSDLDVELFSSTYLRAVVSADVLAENERTVGQQLSSLGLLDLTTGEARVLGVLLVGLDPSSFIPGAYVQFVRYEGTDQGSNVVDQDELRGNLIGTLDTLARVLVSNIRTALREPGGLRQEGRPDYPVTALRELVLNAVTHRDYEHFNAPVRIMWFDDRVEITSPGGPYGVVTKETFDRRNDYRNPSLAAAMKSLGYVNRFGRGITLVRTSLEANGNPPAEFEVEDTYWSVTVRRAL